MAWGQTEALLDELNSMIGLSSVKEEVQNRINMIRVALKKLLNWDPAECFPSVHCTWFLQEIRGPERQRSPDFLERFTGRSVF